MPRSRTNTIVLAALVAAATASCGVDGSARTPRRGEPLVISEIHYRDPDVDAKAEFVEIHNPRSSEVDLVGWCLRGLNFCFEDHTELAAGGYLAVNASETKGSLSTNGERVRLVDDSGRVNDEAAYADDEPWPSLADGLGWSLQRLLPVSDGTEATSWTVGLPTPDEPLQKEPAPATGSVVINEIHYRSVSGDPSLEFVELHNATDARVEVGGWCITELDYCMADGAGIGPRGHLKVTDYQLVRRLDRRGGTLTLIDRSRSTVDMVRYEDRAPWPAMADGTGWSLQRRSPAVSGVEPGNWSAAEPTPGRANRSVTGAVLPMFDVVKFNRSPSPNEPVTVDAVLRNGESPTLVYRIGFGEEVEVPMARTAPGRFTAAVPAQPEGSLVRFRLSSTRAGAVGGWPRPGDGMRYTGTVVDSDADAATNLPRLQWFMEPTVHETAYGDVRKRGDDGYPAVIAYDGEVMDNVIVRVKGQNTKELAKRKWKVVLPKGHPWEMGGWLTNPVNEFALHSMSTDRAMINELLTYEVQKISGGMAQQVLPVRLELNGEFYGLYLYVEQDDGVWRNKYGLSDDTIVFEGRWGAQLPAEDLNLDDWNWSLRYRRSTLRYVDDPRAELAELIENINPPVTTSAALAYIYQSVDIPSVVEAIATMRITQNLDWGRKNWSLMFDPEDQKWRLYPTDHDLSFGRRYKWSCGITCSKVEAVSEPDYFELNRLGRVFLSSTEFRAMIDRRTRTLADAFYTPSFVENRLADYEYLMWSDMFADRLRWPTFGDGIAVTGARREFIDDYLAPKRAMILDGGTDDLPPPQPTSPQLSISPRYDGTVMVTNGENVSIDLSGRSIEGLPGPVPAGVVLVPGQAVIFSPVRAAAPVQMQPAPGQRRTLQVWVPAG